MDYGKVIDMKRKILLMPLLLWAVMVCGENKGELYGANGSESCGANAGALCGAFSVGKGCQVSFSQGNLQYQASTGRWRFAEHQYDMISAANAKISTTYTGWIDLFCWGTGNKPASSATDYSKYTTYTEWGVNAISNGGNVISNGVNANSNGGKAISNGGNEGGQWRTLSKDEWVYLLMTRENAAKLCALGKVNGVNGLILLPDEWSTPQGLTFVPSTQKGFATKSTYYKSAQKNGYSHNVYTAEQWAKMEKAGAVFLPAVGYRWGKDLKHTGTDGCYWSSTPNEEDEAEAYNVDFSAGYIGARTRTGLGFGQSVRLVCPHKTKPVRKRSVQSLDSIPVPKNVRQYKPWCEKSILF